METSRPELNPLYGADAHEHLHSCLMGEKSQQRWKWALTKLQRHERGSPWSKDSLPHIAPMSGQRGEGDDVILSIDGAANLYLMWFLLKLLTSYATVASRVKPSGSGEDSMTESLLHAHLLTLLIEDVIRQPNATIVMRWNMLLLCSHTSKVTYAFPLWEHQKVSKTNYIKVKDAPSHLSLHGHAGVKGLCVSSVLTSSSYK